VGVESFFAILIFGKSFLAVEAGLGIVAPEVVGIIIMGMGLIEVTDEFIKPFFVGDARRALVAEALFADETGMITGVL
jgi:hypothetical protein